MVLKRVYLQNIVFYAMVFFLAMWHAKTPNNASVLALWFLPQLYLIFLSTQLNHTRHNSFTIKIIHHMVFIVKFVFIYATAGLLEFQSISITLIVFSSVIIILSLIEFILLRGKTQVSKYKELIQYTMHQVETNPEEVAEKTKYQNETNFSFISLAFMLGGIHALDIPTLDLRDILFNFAVLLLTAYLYRRLQIANKKIHNRIIEHGLLEIKQLQKKYVFAQIMLHLSMLATIGVRIIDGPNSISFLMIIPILMNLPLIQLNRLLVRSNLTDEEKELMNID